MTLGKLRQCFAIASVVWISHTSASRSDDPGWVPSLAEVHDLEQYLTSGPAQPTGTHPPFAKVTLRDLQNASRYYYGGFYENTKVIKGEILRERDGKGALSIQAEMPIVMDGGCAVINLLYDPALHRFIRFECNGMA